MTDHLTENARLRAALAYYANQFCEGFCDELPSLDFTNADMESDCGGCKARAALATPAPDAVQEAARVLLSLSNEDAQPALDACHGHYGKVAVKQFLSVLKTKTA